MNLDAYMDDFGRDLKRTTPRRRRRPLLALPAVAAAAVGVALLPSGHSIDAIAAARAALSPSGEIVHMKVQIIARKGLVTGPPTEQWYAADPDRWRVDFGIPARPGVAAGTDEMQVAYTPNRMRQYSTKTDKAMIFTGVGSDAPAPGLAGGDPSTTLRDQLAKGDVRDDGVVTVDGKQVRRLVSTSKMGSFNRRLVYYMDPTTFVPLGGHMTFQGLKGAHFQTDFKITGYERIPLNDETAKLLQIQHTDHTKFIWKTITSPASDHRPRPRPSRRAARL